MSDPSTFNPTVILDRLTIDRLRSYLEDCDNDLERALELYAWNSQVAAAFLEDLGRLEVVLRNRFDEALTYMTASAGLPSPWFDHSALFPGRGGRQALEVIAIAKRRASRSGTAPTIQSKVVVEFGFGFWRYLCSSHYHTSMWVPALSAQFPHHPAPAHATRIRTDVERRMGQLHFLRNRVAHHKPIHRRALAEDAAKILELALWMCTDTHDWMSELSRIPSVLAAKPASRPLTPPHQSP